MKERICWPSPASSARVSPSEPNRRSARAPVVLVMLVPGARSDGATTLLVGGLSGFPRELRWSLLCMLGLIVFFLLLAPASSGMEFGGWFGKRARTGSDISTVNLPSRLGILRSWVLVLQPTEFPFIS